MVRPNWDRHFSRLTSLPERLLHNKETSMLKGTRRLACFSLAAGALFGWLAARADSHLFQAARSAEPKMLTAAQADREEPILFEVIVPADAVLEIDGHRTDQ